MVSDAPHTPNGTSPTRSEDTSLAAAYAYIDAGWTEITTLPHGKKASPDKGTTGRSEHRPLSRADLYDRICGSRRTNLGLVMPDGFVGIDIDDYDGKSGAETIAELAERLGDLPPTYATRNRDGGTAGIYIYRHSDADRAAELPDRPGVEIVSPGYRYALVEPSIHPSGRPYYWSFEGRRVTVAPSPDQIPTLPDCWFAELTRDPGPGATTDDLYSQFTGPTTTIIERFRRALADGGKTQSRHGVMLKLTAHLIATGQEALLQTVHAEYGEAFTEPAERKRRLATFDDAVRRARDKGFAPAGAHRAGGGFHLRSADDFEIASVEWLEPDQFPIGFLGVLAGVGGLGKSTYTAALAARLTQGTSGGVHTGRPVRVLICSAEDTISQVVKPRLIAAGADLSRVHFITADADSSVQQPFKIPADLDRLEAAVRGLDDLALVIIDPIVAFIGEATDTHRDKDTRAALAPLAAMADRLGVHILAVMHLNKGTGADLYSRLSSSVAFYNAVRFAALFAENPDDHRGNTRIFAAGKSNLGPMPPSMVYRVEEVTVQDRDGRAVRTSRCVDAGVSQLSADDLLAARGTTESPTKTETAKDIVEEVWMKTSGDAPASAFEDRLREHNALQPSKADQISMDTMRRALKALGGRTRRQGYGPDGGWHWIPPDGYFDQFPPPE